LQLQFFQRIFDADAWLKKMNNEIPKEKVPNFNNLFIKKNFQEQRETVLQEINRVKEDYAYYVTVKKIADEAMKRCNFGKVSLPALWSSHFATF
jgi:poly(A) polymerase Pap1